MPKPLALFLTGLCLLACEPAGPSSMQSMAAPTSKADDDKIVGGQVDLDDPNVVGFYAKRPGADKGELCTAEVIAPTVLLTAAHCVAPQNVGQDAIYRAYLDPDFKDRENPDNWVDVKEVHFLENTDIGVAILARPVSVEPKPLNRASLTEAMIREPVRMIGYGLANGILQTGAGVKRQATTNVVDINGSLLHVGGAGQALCNGDSGGPTLMKIDGVETIIGVASGGAFGCLGVGTATRVDPVAAFIEQYLSR